MKRFKGQSAFSLHELRDRPQEQTADEGQECSGKEDGEVENLVPAVSLHVYRAETCDCSTKFDSVYLKPCRRAMDFRHRLFHIRGGYFAAWGVFAQAGVLVRPRHRRSVRPDLFCTNSRVYGSCVNRRPLHRPNDAVAPASMPRGGFQSATISYGPHRRDTLCNYAHSSPTSGKNLCTSILFSLTILGATSEQHSLDDIEEFECKRHDKSFAQGTMRFTSKCIICRQVMGGNISRTSTRYTVVEPPIIDLAFPVNGQEFVCSGDVTLILSYTTDYDPSPDFSEMGARVSGAAAFVDGYSIPRFTTRRCAAFSRDIRHACQNVSVSSILWVDVAASV